MAEEKKEEKDEKKDKPKRNIDIWLILKIIFVVVNVVVTLGGAVLVYKSTIGWERPQIREESEREVLEKKKETASEQPVIYTMEKFTVNLNGSPQRTLRIEINLEMLGEEGFEEVIRMGAEARDSIVKILNSKNYSEIESIQGKLFLKDQIQQTINGLLVKGIVKEVFFTEFVVGAN